MSGAAGAMLVTGASGFLGAAVIGLLRDRGVEVRALTRDRTWSPPPGVEVVVGDLGDPDLAARAVRGAAAIVHLAAQTSVRASDRDPAADFAANVRPLIGLLEACRASARSPFVVFAGTETQAGLADRLPLVESAPDRPISLYDLHKLVGEQYLELYVRRGWARGMTLRFPTLYGPGPRENGAGRGMINAMVRAALAGGPLTVWGDGDWLRDYLHVQDAAAAVAAAIDTAAAVDGRHYLVGTGVGITVRDAVGRIAEAASGVLGRPVPVHFVDLPPDATDLDRRDAVLDASAFRQATGWRPVHTFADGIAETVQSYSKPWDGR